VEEEDVGTPVEIGVAKEEDCDQVQEDVESSLLTGADGWKPI
jgi:hypothetical protein